MDLTGKTMSSQLSAMADNGLAGLACEGSEGILRVP